MDIRRIVAIIEVDADVAFDKIDDGPVPYLEKSLSQIDGISVEDSFILDEDEDDKQQDYLNYLINWAFHHQGSNLAGARPMSFEEYIR